MGEKKGAGEGRQKAEEDIQAMEDRCNHLSKVKGKLEQSLDETEDALEREKKSKGDVEKLKRKIEGHLKLTQEAVSDLDRIKADLAAGLQRKEKELMSMSAKIEDEGTLGSKYNKQVKELQIELEVELGNVQAHTGENSKGYQKSERRSKELAFQIEEDKKIQDRMSDLANKLQAKIKTYKKQIEETEERA